MKTKTNLGIVASYDPTPEKFHFNRLTEYVLNHGLCPDPTRIDLNSKDPGYFIECSEQSRHFKFVIECFQAMGRYPVHWKIRAKKDKDESVSRENTFPLQIWRKFEPKYFVGVKYFSVEYWGDMLGGPDFGENSEVLGFNVSNVAHLKGKWNAPFAYLQRNADLLVNPKGREMLVDGDLKGLIFREYPCLQPEDAKGVFYLIDSHRIMPSCLLPVVETVDNHKSYVDTVYEPVMLRFRRAEIEAMGEFDMAFTAEEIGPGNFRGKRRYAVISAKFRELLVAAKVRHEVAPVVLVDE